MMVRFLVSLWLSAATAANVSTVEAPRLELGRPSVSIRQAAAALQVLSAQGPVIPALELKPALLPNAPEIPAAPLSAALQPQAEGPKEKLIDTLAAPQPKLEGGGEAVGGTAENDFLSRAQLGADAYGKGVGTAEPSSSFRGGSAAPASHEVLVEAYQDGALDHVGAETKAVLHKAADRAVREKLGQAKFKTFYLYGGFFGTKMYEAPELPGVILKAYASPLDWLYQRMGWQSRAQKGYALAKERLGGYFAHTTIVDNVEVTINGRKKVLRWALVQEKVAVEGIENFGKRSYEVLVGMLKRGVRDNDSRPRNIETVDVARNLGQAPDGRFVHFDADFFGAEKSAEEGPKRVRDPPVLREAIKDAQLAALRR